MGINIVGWYERLDYLQVQERANKAREFSRDGANSYSDLTERFKRYSKPDRADDVYIAATVLLPLTMPLTCDKAASALRRSPSLSALNGPPPGVLAPDMTEEARERTFMTSGLMMSDQRRLQLQRRGAYKG